MSEPWWKKITSYVQGNGKPNPLILTISHDPVVEESLGETLGESMDLVFSDGHHSMESIRQHGRPNLIIGDARLLADSPFGRELRDSEWKTIPLLVIAEATRQLTEQELRNLGATDQIVNPYDVTEIKEKVEKFLFNDHGEEKSAESSAESDNPTQVIEPKVPLKELPKDKDFDMELDNLLAEINKSPGDSEESSIKPINGLSKLTDKLEEIEALTEDSSVIDHKEFEALDMKSKISIEPETEQPAVEFEGYAEESAPGGEEMFDKPLSAESPEVERTPVSSPAPSQAPFIPVSPGVEAWFRQIIEEKAAQVISQTELSEIVGKIAREVVPKIAAEQVSQEIERIKQKIKED